jgi:hypothetical protein
MKKEKTNSNTKVSWKAAALIIGCSALLPMGLFTLRPVFHSEGTPQVESLGGFDRVGSLEGLTLRVGSHLYVCGGPEGQVVCSRSPNTAHAVAAPGIKPASSKSPN